MSMKRDTEMVHYWERDEEEPYCERCGAESIEYCECCPRCHGVGSTTLLSGIEWNYVGSGYGTCPRCGGTGDL